MRKIIWFALLFVLLFASICSASRLELRWDLTDTVVSDITTVIEIAPVTAGSATVNWVPFVSVQNGGTTWVGNLDNTVYPSGSAFKLRAKATRIGVDSQGLPVTLASEYSNVVTAYVPSATPGKPGLTIVIVQ